MNFMIKFLAINYQFYFYYSYKNLVYTEILEIKEIVQKQKAKT